MVVVQGLDDLYVFGNGLRKYLRGRLHRFSKFNKSALPSHAVSSRIPLMPVSSKRGYQGPLLNHAECGGAQRELGKQLGPVEEPSQSRGPEGLFRDNDRVTGIHEYIVKLISP